MLGKTPTQRQTDFFNPLLSDFVDMNHELVLLANHIDWKYFEAAFASLYSNTGRPSVPIRFMVSCLMLKRIYDLGDETLAQAWIMNPYMQYFSGESHFQHAFRVDPSDFVHFRKRIGAKGVEKIFAYSARLHGENISGEVVLSDTTVQENNTTFPTDSKLSKMIIDSCNKIAETEGIKQRQTYTRVSKQLVRATHNSSHPKRAKSAKKARKKIKTIAGRLVRELERKLSPEAYEPYAELFSMYTDFLQQKRGDKNKIYSFHKSFTACIAKGKAHKKYEFGNKVGIMTRSDDLVIVSVLAFTGNPNDGKTIEPLLEQIETIYHELPDEVVYDRGGRGAKLIKGVKISIPSKPRLKDTPYQKRKARQKFRRRAAIEPVFGHLKKHFRMGQNYLWGSDSPTMNAQLAATGWNLKKFMKKLSEEVAEIIFDIFSALHRQHIFQRKPNFLHSFATY